MKKHLLVSMAFLLPILSSIHCWVNKGSSVDKYHDEITSQKDLRMKNTFPKKTNVFFMVDVTCVHQEYTLSLLKNIFNKMSLMNYRISVYTSTGVSQGILVFQCRECTINKLRVPCTCNSTVEGMINKTKEDNKEFLKEGNIIVLVTDKQIKLQMIMDFRRMYDNKGVYIIKIGGGAGKNSTQNGSMNAYKVFHESQVKKEMMKLPFVQEDLNLCVGDGVIRDECNRVCTCVDGVLENCHRVRQEFSSLSFKDRVKLIDIYKTVTTPGKFYSRYLYYVKVHHRYFSKGIHQAYLFLPWHRRLLIMHENLYKLIDCRVTLPFWNWSLYEKIIWSRTPTYHVWDDLGGLGGDGVENLSNCVTTGELSLGKWKTPQFEAVNCILQEICFEGKADTMQRENCAETSWNITVSGYETPIDRKHAKDCFLRNRHDRCLRRKFNGNPPSLENVKNTISYFNATSFFVFEDLVRMHWHAHLHKIIGGHMGTYFTANAPEFWLHHGMVDAIWNAWQKKGEEYVAVGFPGTDTHLVGFEPSEYRHDYLNNSNLAGCGIKVIYEDTQL